MWNSGPGRHAYIHTAAELLAPLAAFEALPLGAVFTLDELPARHAFLRACCVRALLGLEVLALAADANSTAAVMNAAAAPKAAAAA